VVSWSGIGRTVTLGLEGGFVVDGLLWLGVLVERTERWWWAAFVCGVMEDVLLVLGWQVSFVSCSGGVRLYGARRGLVFLWRVDHGRLARWECMSKFNASRRLRNAKLLFPLHATSLPCSQSS
jgi:hypothetical protein